MPAYRLTNAAVADLAHVFRGGIDFFGPAQAAAYHAGLEATFAFLGEFPRAARERTEIDPPVRAYRYKAHLVVYEIGDDDVVLILRVRHGREDWSGDDA